MQLNFHATDINKVQLSGQGGNSVSPNLNPGIFLSTIPVNDDPERAEFVRVRVISNTGVQLSNALFYKVNNPCPQPIMVQWENSLGVPEQHLFMINQEVNPQASEGLAYEIPNNQDIENVTGNKRRVFSEETQSMILLAESLTNNQIKALAEIKTSNKVEVYLDKEGSETVQVICREGLASPYDTKGTRQEFRLVIEFPDNYDFFEAKNY